MTKSLLFITALFFYSLLGFSQTEHSYLLDEDEKQTISSNPGWFEQINANLTQMEYNVSFDKSKNKYQSPNRANNIRSYYRPGLWELKNRVDSAGHNWNIGIELLGIYADDYALNEESFEPSVEIKEKVKENSIEFDHKSYVEQYINSSEGVRQNFIVKDAPKGTSILTVSLKLEGMTAKQASSGGLIFSKSEEELLSYSGLKAWDNNGKELDAIIELIDNHRWSLVVQTEGAIYPITIDPIICNKSALDANTILESNQTLAKMGTTVSGAGDVNGDGYSDVIVGAYLYDNGQLAEGAAFVYHGSSSGLSTTANNMVESNQTNALLGWSVSGAGDINGDGYDDVVAGALYYENGQTDEGAAFIYLGSSSGLDTTVSSILEEPSHYGGGMGVSVTGAGDVNGDGYSDIVVGLYWYNNGHIGEGAALVYHGSSTGIDTNLILTIEGNQGHASLGTSVSGAGDVNGDGYSDVIIGASGYSNGETREGAAFIYYGSSGGLDTTGRSMIESNQAFAAMGSGVSGAGDVNGDGYSDIIVGVSSYDNGQTNEGGAFVYHGSATGLDTSVKSIVESNQSNAAMHSVSSAGDVNGDGYDDVIVGASSYANGQSREGAVFVYRGSASGIDTSASSFFESNQAHARMGYSVAGAGDVNGDGYSDVIIGAYDYDKGETDEGAAFVYHGSSSGLTTSASTFYQSNQTTAYMGWSVSGAGDVNGDGYSDVIVGVEGYDNGQVGEGAAIVFHGSSNGVSTTASSLMESNQVGATMGISVSDAGDVNDDGYGDVIVGASNYTNGETTEGAAFIFYGSSIGIDTSASSIVESNQAQAKMGFSASGAGDVNGDGYDDVIVGAHNYNNGEDFEGAAFIYHGSSTGLDTTVASLLESNEAYAFMGWSVSGAGDVNGDGYSDVILGSWNYTNGQTREGATFVYHGSSSGVDTTISSFYESNKAEGRMGYSVSGAGDVNGDGYDDVIVGASSYNNGESGEGVALVYHGSSNGLDSIASSLFESNQASAYMGNSVSGAGDVNGDGYSDVIVGAFRYDNGETDEGAAFVYLGSSNGLDTIASSFFESNQATGRMGSGVSGAGDVNGDGYDDLIVGASSFSNGENNEGAAFVYYSCPSCGATTERISVVECYQYYSPSGKLWTESGIYTDTIANYVGLDSVIIVDLEILKTTSITIDTSACYIYVSPTGESWTASGTYIDTVLNRLGCDSLLLSVNLIILEASSQTINVSSCYSYLSPSGKEWTVSGTYLDTISNSAGCDSLMAINLNILESSSETINVSSCYSYLSPSGKEWTVSGTYLDTISNSVGCDSLMAINLIILGSSTDTINVRFCYSYLSPSGKEWMISGTYMDTISNSVGCDSIVSINLIILEPSTDTINASSCNSYLSPSGKLWTASGTYLDTIYNSVGCDSLLTINLVILESSSETINTSSCDSYWSPSGKQWTVSGTYQDTIANSVGCDSLVTIELEVNSVDLGVDVVWPGLTSHEDSGTYQWLDCNNNYAQLTNEMAQSYNPQNNGDYAVWVKAQNGCEDTTACYSYTMASIDEIDLGLKYSPNPTTGLIKIELSNSIEGKLEIYNAYGQLLIMESIDATKVIEQELPPSNGLYYIQIIGRGGELALFKVIKQE